MTEDNQTDPRALCHVRDMQSIIWPRRDRDYGRPAPNRGTFGGPHLGAPGDVTGPEKHHPPGASMPRFAVRIASSTRSGDSGRSRWRTPR
jgi:hypothetical protein